MKEIQQNLDEHGFSPITPPTFAKWVDTLHFYKCQCDPRPFLVRDSDLLAAWGVIHCDRCGRECVEVAE
ncbi:MAG: hypothetical protein KJ604_20475 [Gammaproteobacteria bacterium]|nr:hypothetical protein [Gammaproteobacteria bacterium]